MPASMEYSDTEAARALTEVLGHSEWVGVQLAKGALAIQAGETVDDAAEQVFREGPLSRAKCREQLSEVRNHGFLSALSPRSDVGSSVNQMQAGNAVPSLLAEVIGQAIRHQWFDMSCSSNLTLLPESCGTPPPPEPIQPVPRKFWSLDGDHADHPGTGKGSGAIRRRRKTAIREES